MRYLHGITGKDIVSYLPDSVVLLLDGASIERMPEIVFQHEDNPEYVPLYWKTEYFEVMHDVSPWLVRTRSNGPLLSWFFTEKADAGILFYTDMPLGILHKQLLEIFEAKLPDYSVTLFRFYDPTIVTPLAFASLYDVMDSIVGEADAIVWKNMHPDYTGTFSGYGRDDILTALERNMAPYAMASE